MAEPEAEAEDISPKEPIRVIDGRWDEPRYLRFGDDEACLFTTISPIKTTSNEDCFLFVPLDENRRVLVVADGVGGMPDGDHASRLTVESIQHYLEEGVPQNHRVRELLLDAIENAHHAIRDRSQGSATTVAVVEIEGSLARTYHVGDSEILFHSNDDGLLWKSLPHSPVGYAVESGQINIDDALFDESRHLVSNVIGADVLSVEINGTFELRAGETLLLGSDGVFDNLRLEEILEYLKFDDLQEAANQLINECRRRMINPDQNQRYPSKPDDLTMILYRWAANPTAGELMTMDGRNEVTEDTTIRKPPEVR